MEKHFIAEMMAGQGKPKFRAEPWYNPDGDCIVYKMADEAVVADRIDELLTVYNSAVDNRAIGFQIKGVQAIIRKLGLDGLAVASESDAGGVKSISIAALLLAAYEEGEPTLARRRAYASVMECPAEKRTILADDLQPAGNRPSRRVADTKGRPRGGRRFSCARPPKAATKPKAARLAR